MNAKESASLVRIDVKFRVKQIMKAAKYPKTPIRLFYLFKSYNAAGLGN